MTQLRKLMLEELQRRNYAQTTVEAYTLALRQFAEYFHRPPDQLGPEHIREFQLHLIRDRNLAANTVKQRMAAVQFFFVRTLKRPYLREDFPYPKIPRRLPAVLSQEEVTRLIDSASNLSHRAILMTLYSTGLRRSEVARLQVRDIDSERMVIHVRQGKGRKDRDVPLSPKLLETLREYWRWRRPQSYLFPGGAANHGKDVPITGKGIWHACREAVRRAGIQKKVGPHTLRHSYATHLLESGADLRTIQLLLGHADIKHTTVYLHLSQRHLHAVANPLDALAVSAPQDAKLTQKADQVSRPPIEVADIIRARGNRFIENNRSWLRWPHIKVLRAIAHCRTAALGGHRDQCPRCGYQAISYYSCRNRHCPKCQTTTRDKWLAARQQELLPVPYSHVVFTLPQELSLLALQNKKTIYSLLFRASAETLLQVAADPKHLGAQIGFLSVLHTWGQNLLHHPHVHCVIPAGGLSPDHSRWVRPRYAFFLPVKVLSRVFRGKVTAGLKRLFRQRKLVFAGKLQPLANPKAFRSFLRPLFRKDWIVYAKAPFGGPHHVLHYLARYTHRVAISNHRLVAFEDNRVTFRWKDYAHGNKQSTMTLSTDEFLRRFLLHVLPRAFVRIRFFGFLANRRRTSLLPLCQQVLAQQAEQIRAVAERASASPTSWLCPNCSTPMLLIEQLSGTVMTLVPGARTVPLDTS